MPRKKTDYLVVHCAATKPSMDIGWKEIDRWHRQRGWLKIGYHYVIRRDGTVEPGRELMEIGAHVKGYNSVSVGICLVGGIDEKGKPDNNFSDEQMAALGYLLTKLKKIFPDAKVVGHRDLFSGKACPCFDAGKWYAEWLALQDSTKA